MDTAESKNTRIEFKKPILIGKIGKLPRKIGTTITTVSKVNENEQEVDNVDKNVETNEKDCKNVETNENETNSSIQILENRLPYKEPEWSGIPDEDRNYMLEVLKSGKIIENINLKDRPYWVFGRLGNCDMIMAHPTISRYHAVLQYRSKSDEEHPKGFYLYDLGSTHGTFLNKNQLKSKVYVRVQVGHMIKLGCSSRTYILNGPENDQENESELSITELKLKRMEELKTREVEKQAFITKKQMEIEEKERIDSERGIDWGMGEDADETTDLSENPYAQTNNEDLYLEDPKKALRGFMEREGIDYEYVCTEQGIGQFLCKVELPVDDENGRPIFAEALHKGKKKEAVIQCALEACRILDRHGLLRQATHASRKRKTKNWEEDDYYDSDDDPFLDRTGTIEKKRESRMKAKAPQTAETYESLLEKEKGIRLEIMNIEKQLKETKKNSTKNNVEGNEDSLDTFMKELTHSKLDKQRISKLKTDLTRLKKDHSNILRLANVAKPADMPALKPFYEVDNTNVNVTNVKPKGLPIYGKRMKVKVQLPEPKNALVNWNDEDDDDDAEEKIVKSGTSCICSFSIGNKKLNPEIFNVVKEIILKEQKCLERSKEFLNKAMEISKRHDINKSSSSEDYIKSLNSYLNYCNNKLSLQENEIAKLNDINNRLKEVEQMEVEDGKNVKDDREENDSIEENDCTAEKDGVEENDGMEENGGMEEKDGIKEKVLTEEEKMELSKIEEEKRKRRNQRRIQQRQDKLEIQKIKGYDEDSHKEDYNMWVPPGNQTGDGRTMLNDKLGY